MHDEYAATSIILFLGLIFPNGEPPTKQEGQLTASHESIRLAARVTSKTNLMIR